MYDSLKQKQKTLAYDFTSTHRKAFHEIQALTCIGFWAASLLFPYGQRQDGTESFELFSME